MKPGMPARALCWLIPLALVAAIGSSSACSGGGAASSPDVPNPPADVDAREVTAEANPPDLGMDASPEPGDLAPGDPAANPEPEVDAAPEASPPDAVPDLPDAPLDLSSEPVPDLPAETPADLPAEAVSACKPAPRPVVLVHGVNGSSADYSLMIERLKADGWPADWLFAFDAADPKWGCNVDNAEAIRQLVNHALEVTGQGRVDLVAHSMGTLSSRYYVKNLGGTDVVNTYVTLGGMHHGLTSPCWSPFKPCIWEELCATGDFIAALNADPATPGSLHWVSIYGTADQTVPNDSSYLEGAENIALEGVEHDGANGLQQNPAAYAEVKRVLEYGCW